MNRNSLVAVASLLFTVSSAQAALFDHSVVTAGDLTARGHIDGRTIVGGNLSAISQPIFGSAVTNAAGTTVLGVAGNTTGSGMTVQGGVFRAGGTTPANGFTLNLNNGATRVNGSVDVSALAAEMTSLSATYDALASNSSYALTEGKRVTFNAVAGENGRAVVTLPASVFTTNNLEFDVAMNGASELIINVDGALANNAKTGNFVGTFATAATASKVLWNFADATSLSVTGAFWGTILAPKADVTQGNSNIDGSVFAKSLDARAEIHQVLFVGQVPEPTALVAGVAACLAIGGRRRRSVTFRQA